MRPVTSYVTAEALFWADGDSIFIHWQSQEKSKRPWQTSINT